MSIFTVECVIEELMKKINKNREMLNLSLDYLKEIEERSSKIANNGSETSSTIGDDSHALFERTIQKYFEFSENTELDSLIHEKITKDGIEAILADLDLIIRP